MRFVETLVFEIGVEQEPDGRWAGESFRPRVRDVAFGESPKDARRKALALALRAKADQLEAEEVV